MENLGFTFFLKDLGLVLLFAFSVDIVWFEMYKNRGGIVEKIKGITGCIMILEAENGVSEASSNSGLVCYFYDERYESISSVHTMG